MLIIKGVDINLKDTICCGQIFRYYEEDDDSYTVILSDRIVNLKMDDSNLIVLSDNYDKLEEIIRDYLDLNRDYDSINEMLLKNDENLKDIINYSKGFKIMHTPKLETYISYILSQNNGVPQIRNSLNLISEKCGEKKKFNGKIYYLFPSLENLKKLTVEDFHECKCGFRDKYLYGFIKEINKSFNLDEVDNLNSNDALKYLMNVKGIGLKVASCILLFAYQRFDVFPVDTWVKKYFKTNNVKYIENYSKEKWKGYSALVIQYIFNYSRNKVKN